jgi:hypothetical protein
LQTLFAQQDFSTNSNFDVFVMSFSIVSETAHSLSLKPSSRPDIALPDESEAPGLVG